MNTHMSQDPHAQQPIFSVGPELGTGRGVIILFHGRGSSAEDILSLGGALNSSEFTLLAPQAMGNTWYPYSFLEPASRNEPYLSSALGLAGSLLQSVLDAGVRAEKIVLAGFSQGACLTLEFAARNARRFGGAIAFTGGLIGDATASRDYAGSLAGTPVFIGSSDVDPHVPLLRLQHSAEVLTKLGGTLDLRIYPGMGHTINQDEISAANAILASITA